VTGPCEVINDCFVKYEETQNILYEKGNAEPLEGNNHMSDDMESRKSDDMKTQEEARLCLVAAVTTQELTAPRKLQ